MIELDLDVEFMDLDWWCLQVAVWHLRALLQSLLNCGRRMWIDEDEDVNESELKCKRKDEYNALVQRLNGVEKIKQAKRKHTQLTRRKKRETKERPNYS